MTEEQRYWSLSGSFNMIAYIGELILNEEVKSLNELRKNMVIIAETIHEKMTELEREGINNKKGVKHEITNLQ